MSDWQIKRGEQVFLAPDIATLQQWTQEGRVLPGDYVFNPILQRWMYASELAELRAAWHGNTTSSAKARGCAAAIALGLLALMFVMWRMPAIGLALFIGAVAASVYAS
jgi:hypothetical protein